MHLAAGAAIEQAHAVVLVRRAGVPVDRHGAVRPRGMRDGTVIDRHGYTPVIVAVAFTPLAACAVLWFARSTR